jgi:hypothetical protein
MTTKISTKTGPVLNVRSIQMPISSGASIAMTIAKLNWNKMLAPINGFLGSFTSFQHQLLKIARIEKSANVISGCGATPISSVAAVEAQSGHDRLGAMTTGLSSFGGIKNM